MPDAISLRRFLIAGLSCIVCLTVGFLIGSATTENARNARNTVTVTPAPKRADWKGVDDTTAALLAGRITSPNSEGKSMAEILATRAITETPGLSRLGAFHEIIAKIDASNWRDFQRILWNARAANLISIEEIIWVMERIGEVAGRDAMEAFKRADPVANSGIAYSGSAMRGWAAADGKAAEAYIDSLVPGKFRKGMINGFVLGAGPTDITTCRRFLAFLSPSEQQQTLREALNTPDGVHFAPLARAWLDSFERETPSVVEKDGSHDQTDEGRSVIFEVLANQQRMMKWADHTGEKFVGWVNGFVGKRYVTSQVVSEAAALKAEQNPEEALSWLESFGRDTPKVANGAVISVMSTFAKRDLSGATRWLDANPDSPYYGEAIVGLLNAQGEQMDDATADAWVSSIRNDLARADVSQSLASKRKARDAVQANVSKP